MIHGAMWSKVGPTHLSTHINRYVSVEEKIHFHLAASTTSQKKNACPASLTTEKPAKMGWQENILGSFTDKKKKKLSGGKWKYEHFLDIKRHSTSRLTDGIFKNSLDYFPLFALGLFFQGMGEQTEKTLSPGLYYF